MEKDKLIELPPESERQAFEQWARDQGMDVSPWLSGVQHGYSSVRVNDYWEGWKARAALRSSSAAPAKPPCARCGGTGEIFSYESTPGGSRVRVVDSCPMCSAAPIEEAMDAKRYRWLRDKAHPDRDDTGLACVEADVSEWGRHYNKHLSGEKLDAAIDNAMAKEPTK